MGDEILQLGFKKFTTSEIVAGTRWDALTTNASTHYVIKSIECTQNNNANAVDATATIGLTTDFSATPSKYVSLGNVGKANRVGLSGSAIMDASSTLSIRPTAKSIVFADEVIQRGSIENDYPTKARIITNPSVDGTLSITDQTMVDIDKSSVTFNSAQNVNMATPQAGNFTVYYTNANGVPLRILFQRNSSGNNTSFEVWNQDGTSYGYYNDSYDTPFWDGGRYIFWVDTGQYRVRWYDLDESTTNLAAGNTTGGGNGANFYHGQTPAFTDGPSFNSRSTYDAHRNAFYHNRHTNGKRYYVGWSQGQTRFWCVEFPDTLVNDSSSTGAAKWLYFSSTSYSTNGNSPFGGNNGSSWNFGGLTQQVSWQSNQSDMRLTYDTEKERYYIWVCPGSARWYCFTFTQAEFDGRGQGNVLSTTGSTGVQSNGLFTVASNENGDINVDGAVWNANGSRGYLDFSSVNSVISSIATPPTTGGGSMYVDGKYWYFKSQKGGATEFHPFKLPVDDVSTSALVALDPNPGTAPSKRGDFFVGFGTPTATQIANRNYPDAPNITVRISGILSDQ